jgi:hypothetical protein
MLAKCGKIKLPYLPTATHLPAHAGSASARIVADSGRVKKTVQSAEIVIAWWKFCSASGPRIILMTTGTVGNS